MEGIAMKRPHEDPACHCPACEAYDNRGSDVEKDADPYWCGGFLTINARQYVGIERTPGETDAQLRARCYQILGRGYR
jgi:hypothetical protein